MCPLVPRIPFELHIDVTRDILAYVHCIVVPDAQKLSPIELYINRYCYFCLPRIETPFIRNLTAPSFHFRLFRSRQLMRPCLPVTQPARPQPDRAHATPQSSVRALWPVPEAVYGASLPDRGGCFWCPRPRWTLCNRRTHEHLRSETDCVGQCL